MAVRPKSLSLRCYGVGFGDCFLLSFHYGGSTGDRHVLIDFGSTQRPPNPRKNLMKEIAADIAATVGPQLHVVVATHRHTDHISGFATDKKGKGTGAVIAGLKPQLVIQPWTEKLGAARDWKGPQKALNAAAESAVRLALDRMSAVAAMSRVEARHLSPAVRQEIGFIAEDGVKNLSAVRNLAALGKTAYVFYGKKLPALKKILPGVAVEVLGPPTLKQKSDVADQKARNTREYWHFTSFWQLQAATALAGGAPGMKLFERAATIPNDRIPVENRWFVGRLKEARGEQLLRIVRSMDAALNNTSVILLIRAGTKKFLFPGDAQWENWEYALGKRLADLADVDVYKVGHHGSLNATPKTLWDNFAKRADADDAPGRLCTVMSTRSDSKHGHPESGTEVPRSKLITALKAKSNLRSTQELEREGGLVLKLDFDLS